MAVNLIIHGTAAVEGSNAKDGGTQDERTADA